MLRFHPLLCTVQKTLLPILLLLLSAVALCGEVDAAESQRAEPPHGIAVSEPHGWSSQGERAMPDERPERLNSSLFARGYGVLVSVGLFIAGMLLRREWGAFRSAVAAGIAFGILVCADGFNLGFPWYGVLFGAVLSAFMLGMFVWVGMGNDLPSDPAK